MYEELHIQLLQGWCRNGITISKCNAESCALYTCSCSHAMDGQQKPTPNIDPVKIYTYFLTWLVFNAFNFGLEYAIRRVQVNQDGLKLNGTHQLLAYAEDVNILAGSIHTLKENAEALVAATREIGLEVSGDKTKYMVMSQDQNAGRIQSVPSRGWKSLNICEQL